MIAFEKEESHKVDVVGKLLDFDHIGERHLGLFGDAELLACVDIRLLILLVHLALAQVVVLNESLTKTENVARVFQALVFTVGCIKGDALLSGLLLL